MSIFKSIAIKIMLKVMERELNKLKEKNMDTKSIFKSKTLWANVIAVALIVLQEVFQIKPATVSPEYQTVILAVVNMFLRFFTSKSVNV